MTLVQTNIITDLKGNAQLKASVICLTLKASAAIFPHSKIYSTFLTALTLVDIPSSSPQAEAPMENTAQRQRHIRINFQDDAPRQRSQEKLHQLVMTAARHVTDATSTNAQLARKALRYRKVLGRLADVDATSPQFDVAKFMGVDWVVQTKPSEHSLGV